MSLDPTGTLDKIDVEEIFPGDILDTIQSRYPHVGNLLHSSWGSEWFNHYIEDLQVTDRDDRIGFDFDIFFLLQLLEDLHTSMTQEHLKKLEKYL